MTTRGKMYAQTFWDPLEDNDSKIYHIRHDEGDSEVSNEKTNQQDLADLCNWL